MKELKYRHNTETVLQNLLLDLETQAGKLAC